MEKVKKFLGLLSSDFLKLSKMKSVYIGIGVMAFLTLIFALAQNALTSFIQEYPADGGTLDPDTVEGLTGTFVFTLLNAAPSSTGVFFLLPIIAALFIGTDFSSGMMRLYIGRGVQKTELYLSKFIVITSVSVCTCVLLSRCAGLRRRRLILVRSFRIMCFPTLRPLSARTSRSLSLWRPYARPYPSCCAPRQARWRRCS